MRCKRSTLNHRSRILSHGDTELGIPFFTHRDRDSVRSCRTNAGGGHTESAAIVRATGAAPRFAVPPPQFQDQL